jgi:hypothetical protein
MCVFASYEPASYLCWAGYHQSSIQATDFSNLLAAHVYIYRSYTNPNNRVCPRLKELDIQILYLDQNWMRM